MINVVNKITDINTNTLFTTTDQLLPDRLLNNLSFNWINVVSLDVNNNPIKPTAGNYFIYVKTSSNTGFEKADKPINFHQAGGSSMVDGHEKGSFYGAIVEQIKIIPAGIVGATNYQVHVRQSDQGRQPEVPVKLHSDAVADGFIQGSDGFFAFGKNPNMTKDVTSIITDFTSTYNFLSVAQPIYISSSSATDTSVTMLVSVLDVNYDRVDLVVNVNGQTKTLLAGGNYIRIFSVFNIGNVSHVGDVYVYPNITVTAGVPNDLTQVIAKSDIAKQQSNMAILTIPNNKRGLLKTIIVTANKANTTGAADLFLATRDFNGVKRIRAELNLQTAGDPTFNFNFVIPIALPTKSDIWIEGIPTVSAYSIAAGFQVLIEDL